MGRTFQNFFLEPLGRGPLVNPLTRVCLSFLTRAGGKDECEDVLEPCLTFWV